MRARYTAFTLGEIDFILNSHHPKTRKDVKREDVESWSKNSKWLGLKIVQSEAGTETDTTGAIVFCAGYEADGTVEEHWEQALFEKDGKDWYFLDARSVKTGTFKREGPKTGRNDPCVCGSGKKFKKCCAT